MLGPEVLQAQSQPSQERASLPAPPSSAMLAAPRVSQLPSPPMLERSIGYSCSDPARYGSRLPAEPKLSLMPGTMDRLPPLSQLLTPASQPPYLPSLGLSGSTDRPSPAHERRYDLPSPRRLTPAEAQAPRPPSGYFPNAWGDTNREARPPTAPAPPPGPPSTSSLDSTTRTFRPVSANETSPRQLPAVKPVPPQPSSSSSSSLPLQHSARTAMQWAPSQSPQSAHSTVSPAVSSTNNTDGRVPDSAVAAASRRLLGERIVPGEGRVYVYDDGTKIPTVVDGEPVNGQWGMTKAGKPRKRMPQACVPCRQKKIKCDPGDGKCAQCEKSGKDCRYSEGHRAHKNSPGSPRTTVPGTPLSERPVSSPRSANPRSVIDDRKRRSTSADSKVRHGRIASIEGTPLAGAPSPKRPRLEPDPVGARTYGGRTPYPTSTLTNILDTPPPGVGSASRSPAVSTETPEAFLLEDPYVLERKRVDHYLEYYFTRVNNGTFCVLPRRSFMAWVRSKRTKSQGELMVLYALMAGGAQLTDMRDENSSRDSARYQGLVRRAIETTAKCQGLLMVLARLYLGYTYFTLGDFSMVLHMTEVSRAVSLLKIDAEERLEAPDNDGLYDFGLNRFGLEELYRRAEWFAFLVDRLISMRLNYPLCFRKEEHITRLPCCDELYDRQVEVRTPYFDNGILARKYTDGRPDDTPQGLWSYFLQGVSFDSDIRRNVYRSEWQDDTHYPGNYDSFSKSKSRELDEWMFKWPAILQFTDANIDMHMERNNLCLFLAIHAVYHVSHMLLGRRVRAHLLPASHAANMGKAILCHAHTLLDKNAKMYARLQAAKRATGAEIRLTPVPFVTYGIFAAIDALTAAGRTDNPDETARLFELYRTGVDTISQLTFWYPSARSFRDKIIRRLDEVQNVLDEARKADARKAKAVDDGVKCQGPEAWVCCNPLDQQHPKNHDLFYRNKGVSASILGLLNVQEAEMRVEYLQTEGEGSVDVMMEGRGGNGRFHEDRARVALGIPPRMT